MEEKYIGKYKLTCELKGQNSGCARWGFCTFAGNDYFIKEFISPVYPDQTSKISPQMRNALVTECLDYEKRKNRLYTAINASSNGNIIGIKNFFRFKSRYYIVTEKLDTNAVSLEDIVRLPMEKKLLLLRVLLYNVKCLHETGIVHADLKPDNLIFKYTKNGFYTVKLIDFDSSFFENDAPSNPDDIQGDLTYLSPEVFLKIAGESVALTTKLDVFALGIIFHQFLTGTVPAIRDGYDYLYEAALDGGEIGISRKIPPKVAQLIRKMLSANPSERPSTSEIFDYLGNEEHKKASNANTVLHRDSSLD